MLVYYVRMFVLLQTKLFIVLWILFALVFIYTILPLSCCRRNSSQSCGSCSFSSSWETQPSWLHFLSAKEGNLGWISSSCS